MQVHSFFDSISGEAGGFPQGTWCSFIRLQGCNLKCAWCDTPDAQPHHTFDKNLPMTAMEIVNRCSYQHIIITGGEPLIQRQEALGRLLQLFDERRSQVQVETNGSIEIPTILQSYHDVHWVMDRKCPSSGMNEYNLPCATVINLVRRHPNHVHLKYVIADTTDLNFALRDIEELDSVLETASCPDKYLNPFILSPLNAEGFLVQGMVQSIYIENSDLLDRIVFSIQLHKKLGMA